MSANSPKVIGVAIVESRGEFLVGRRGPEGPLAGYDEFPGGKCRDGETAAQCAVRECGEETGLTVAAVELLLSRKFTYDHGTLDLHFWRCRLTDTAAKNVPSGGFRWVPASALARLRFPEANAPLLELLTSDGESANLIDFQ